MKQVSALLMIVASSSGLAACMPAKSTSERLATIDAQLAEWQPMVDMMRIRQGSDGRYQLLIAPPATDVPLPAPAASSTGPLDPTQRLDAQATALCALSRTVGRVQVRQGSDGREQLLALSQPSPLDEERYCPGARGPAPLRDEARLTLHETLVAEMSDVIGGVVFCRGADNRFSALVERRGDKQKRCARDSGPQ